MGFFANNDFVNKQQAIEKSLSVLQMEVGQARPGAT